MPILDFRMQFMGHYFSNIFVLLILISANLSASSVYGEVVDSGSKESLIGALVSFGDKSVITDSYGRFQIFTEAVENTSVTISVSYIGYAPSSIEAKVGTFITVALTAGIDLPSVVVNSDVEKPNISNLSVLSPSMKLLNRIPSLGGERDPIKALQTFPGVSAGVEGTADIHVRGGTSDQNLLLLDGATIYNANHLFGFLSPFQPSIIKDIQLYKGGFPAEFGGRLSSIIDITTDEGNKNEWDRDLTVGLINSSFKVSGPLQKDKLSLSIGGRLSYLTMIAFLNPDENVQRNWFYDVNAKLNYKSERSNLSAYMFSNYDRSLTRDDFLQTPTEGSIDYGNLTGGLRWFYSLSPATTIETTANLTRYNYTSVQKVFGENTELLNSVKNNSFIAEQSLKSKLKFQPSAKISLTAGGEVRNRLIVPSNSTFGNNETGNIENSERGQDAAVFIESRWKISSKFSATIGGRVQLYWLDGVTGVNTFIEPRFSAKYSPSNSLDLFASYSRMSQNLHLLTTNLIGIPTNSWVMANQTAPPSISDNFAFGISKRLDAFAINIEAFHKKSSGIVDPLPGISLFQNVGTDWTNLVSTDGTNKVQGLELLLNTSTDDYFGLIAYTLSWNRIRYDEINNGDFYFRQFDRRHELNLTGGKELGKGWRSTANFIYGSGLRMTLPVATYYDGFTQTVIPVYTGRYQQKVPPSHRLDIGFEHRKKSKSYSRIWTLGCYNIYARRNPTFVIAEGDIVPGEQPKIRVIAQTRSPFTFIPYISYSRNW